MKMGLIGFILFFVFGNLATVAASDTGIPDTAYVECSGFAQGALTIRIMFVTDNAGDTNKIDGFSFPIYITNSNPAADPMLDSTLGVTYSGSAAGGFSALSNYVVPIIDSIICDTFMTCSPAPSPCSIEVIPQPGCFCLNDSTFCCIDSITCDTFFEPDLIRAFPLQYNLIALNLQDSAAIGAGRYLFANLKIQVDDTTTICVDTHRTQTVTLFFLNPNNHKYFPQWLFKCCKVVTTDFGYKSGDANCSGGNPNLGDIIYLVNYVFKGGSAPCIGRLGDANCSGGKPNLTDIIYLVSYVFKGGNAPIPCP
ncbi:MAG: hypothetical protein RBG1_1C00001G0587 [candidate division Zixibacteria bacterium RBG-1]|nr:MAG: hypothetical protein RBG1_1C00001G0587 [candidate division Zixibacteria bacterium RBG-1]OGC85077.1 MAG: hypothetical protein A2V73_03055 [candidate division Zixibacteria bacterium RBG_19FT_COMBO_42_43]